MISRFAPPLRRWTEGLLRSMSVVRGAQNPQVFWLVSSTKRERLDVVDLEVVFRRAAVAVRSDIGALLLVAKHDLVPDRVRDVP